MACRDGAGVCLAALSLLCLVACAVAEVSCEHDNEILPLTRIPLITSSGTDRRSKTPPGGRLEPRSIVGCRGQVERVKVGQNETQYEGVPLGGVVSIVESETIWKEDNASTHTGDPVCTGIFLSPSKILSSANW